MSKKREPMVLVQPQAPTVVAVDREMGREAWQSYYQAIWAARLSAHLHARYFSRLRRLMGWLSALLQAVVIVGSGSAFASVASSYGGRDFVAASTLVVAITAVALQVTGLVGRVEKAAALEEAWAVRCSFWDDALVLVQDSRYLGTLSELQAPEAALRRVEAELGVPQVRWYIAKIQAELVRADPFASAQVAS